MGTWVGGCQCGQDSADCYNKTHLDNLLGHVDEAGVSHALGQGVGDADLLCKDLCGVVAQVLPAQHGVGILNGAVVALAQGDGLLELEPAARLQVGVALAHEAVPVGDGAAQGADVDVVKVLVRAVDPLALGVVDVELCIGGHPGGLDGAEVGAKDVAARVLVGKVNGPDAGAGANVEGPARGGADGGVVQLAVEDEGEDVVQQVEAVLLLLVVGQDVGAGAVAVVAAAVGVLVVEDGRGERGAGGAGGVEGAVCVAARVWLEVVDGLEGAVRLRGGFWRGGFWRGGVWHGGVWQRGVVDSRVWQCGVVDGRVWVVDSRV